MRYASTQGSSQPYTDVFQYIHPAPSAESLLASLASYDPPIPSKLYRDPFYSNPADKPTRAVEVAGYPILISGDGLGSLPAWDSASSSRNSHPAGAEWSTAATPTRSRHYTTTTTNARRDRGSRLCGRGVAGWAYAGEPPGSVEIRKWLEENPVPVGVRFEGSVRGLRKAQVGVRSQVGLLMPFLMTWRECKLSANLASEDYRPDTGNAVCQIKSKEDIFYSAGSVDVGPCRRDFRLVPIRHSLRRT